MDSHKICLIVLIELALISMIQNCCAFKISLANLNEYTRLPTTDGYNIMVRDALLELQIDPGSKPFEILSKIESLARSSDYENTYKLILSMCREYDGKPEVLSEEQVRLLKSIVVQVKRDEKGKLGQLDEFIKHCGKINLKQRADYAKIFPARYETVFELDGLFGKAFGLTGPEPDDDELISHLAGFRMEQSDMDVRGMFDFIRPGQSGSASTDSLETIYEYLTRKCYQLNLDLLSLDTIIMAALINDEEFDANHVEVVKRIEYRRLCLAWNDQETFNLIRAHMTKSIRPKGCRFLKCFSY